MHNFEPVKPQICIILNPQAWNSIAGFDNLTLNLIKEFHNQANTPLITKITSKTFLVEVIRPAKVTIWQHHSRNKLFLKMKLSYSDNFLHRNFDWKY